MILKSIQKLCSIYSHFSSELKYAANPEIWWRFSLDICASTGNVPTPSFLVISYECIPLLFYVEYVNLFHCNQVNIVHLLFSVLQSLRSFRPMVTTTFFHTEPIYSFPVSSIFTILANHSFSLTFILVTAPLQ